MSKQTWTLVTPDGADRDTFDTLQAAKDRVQDYLKVGWPLVDIRNDLTGEWVDQKSAPAVQAPAAPQVARGKKAPPSVPVVNDGFDQAIAHMLVAVRDAAKTGSDYPDKELSLAQAAISQLQAEADWILDSIGHGPTPDRSLALHRSVASSWKIICDRLALDLAFMRRGK